jgi:hypothetical protein
LEISKLRNVKIIPGKTKFIELLKKCRGVITVGATTGFEAMIYDKPVIVFGNPFYAQSKTVIKITELRDLPHVLLRVINDPHYGIDLKKRAEFIGKYYAHQVPLKSKPVDLASLSLDDDEAVILSNTVKDATLELMKRNVSLSLKF